MKLAKILNFLKYWGVGDCGLAGDQHSPECSAFHFEKNFLALNFVENNFLAQFVKKKFLVRWFMA